MTSKAPLSQLEKGVRVSASVSKQRKISASACSECPDGCYRVTLDAPFVIATARHILAPQVAIPIDDDVLHGDWLDFGQDALYSLGRRHPGGFSVGATPAELAPRMRRLLDCFASGDPDGKAQRLMDAFLSKRERVEVYTDPALDKAIAQHENFQSFARAALRPPGSPDGPVRIHQALARAGWDINKVATLTDLRPPAWNVGSKVRQTGDYNTGLGLMMNGVQHVIILAQDYTYVSCEHQYRLKLKFAMYDVFGLDDGDLTDPVTVWGMDVTTVGARDRWATDAQQGITAWWQLQHEHDHAPLVARGVVEREFVVSTAEEK